MKLIYPLVIILLFHLSSCDKCSQCKRGELATIRDFTGLDGCGWVIVLNNGENLEPKNLHSFGLDLKDGMKIKVKYHEEWGASVCMMGKLVEIDCIKEM